MEELLEKLQSAFAAFQKANDERLSAIEKRGHADPLLVEKVEKLNAEVGRVQKMMDEVSTKAGRPSPTEKAVDAEHKKAFCAFLRSGDESGLRQRAITIGSDPDGGYAVPEELDRTIAQLEKNATPLRGICNVFSAGNETYEKLVNVGGTASGWVGETDARATTAASALASVKPSFGEVYANPAASQKALDDIFFDVEAWLADEVASKFAQDEDAAFVSGSGTNRPKGFLAYTLAETADATRTFGQLEKMTTATQAVFTADELITFVHKLKAGYRQNATFVMPSATVAAVRKLKEDGTSGQYLWQPGLGGGQASTLLGFPIVEDENVPAIAASANCMLFGDFKRAYTIVDVKGVRVLRDPYTNKPYVNFYSTKRLGGGVVDSCAVKVLTLHA